MSSQARVLPDSGSTWETEVPGLPGDCQKHPGGDGRTVSKGKWRFTGRWEQEACIHTRVYPCGHVERDWMRLRPRDGRSSGDRRSGPRNKAGWGRMLEPGLGSPGASEGQLVPGA